VKNGDIHGIYSWRRDPSLPLANDADIKRRRRHATCRRAANRPIAYLVPCRAIGLVDANRRNFLNVFV